MKKEGGNSTQMAAIKLEEVYKPDKHDCFLMFFLNMAHQKLLFPIIFLLLVKFILSYILMHGLIY